MGSAIVFVAYMLTGLVSAIIFSAIVDRTKQFNLIQRTLCFLSLLSFLPMFVTVPSGNLWLLAMNTSVMGVFMVPVIKISYTYVVELTHPIKEPVSNGVLQLSSMISSAIGSICVTQLIQVYGPNAALFTFLAMIIFSLVSIMFVKQDLRRLNEEKILNDEYRVIN